MIVNFLENEHCITYGGPEGDEVCCDINMYFSLEETGSRYLFYSDRVRNEDGSYRRCISRCIPMGERMELEEIDSDREWKAVMDQVKKRLIEAGRS